MSEASQEKVTPLWPELFGPPPKHKEGCALCVCCGCPHPHFHCELNGPHRLDTPRVWPLGVKERRR
jgi:hypothetical protein